MLAGEEYRGSGTSKRDNGANVLPMATGVRRDEHVGRAADEEIGAREYKAKTVGSGFIVRQRNIKGRELKKLLSPAKRKAAVLATIQKYKVSERRACLVLGVNRAAYKYKPVRKPDEDELRMRIIYLACNWGRYGYRMVTGMLRNEGRNINHKRVERIWREEGLKVPEKQRKRSRLWLTDGSCIRLRAEHRNHVWSYDFVSDRTMDGRQIRWLNVIDEYTHECLASIPRRSFRSNDVIEVLAELILTKGTPEYLRSDNGSEFTAKKLLKWLYGVGITTTFIEPGSPWENGYCESFNARMRAEFLNGELFGSMFEAATLTKLWVTHYNTIRPHSSLGYRPPAPQSVVPAQFLSAS